jgi:hypothetical protein
VIIKGLLRRAGGPAHSLFQVRLARAVRRLRMSVRFAPAPNQPINAIGDSDDGESGASDVHHGWHRCRDPNLGLQRYRNLSDNLSGCDPIMDEAI